MDRPESSYCLRLYSRDASPAAEGGHGEEQDGREFRRRNRQKLVSGDSVCSKSGGGNQAA